MDKVYYEDSLEEIITDRVIDIDESVLLDLKLVIESNDFYDDEKYKTITGRIDYYGLLGVVICDKNIILTKCSIYELNMYANSFNKNNNKKIKKYDNTIEISLQLFNDRFIY